MSTVTFPDWLAQQHPAIPLAGARAILALAEGGATVPFIARYRKEQTGNLDEVAIRQVIDAKERWDGIAQAPGFIVEEIDAPEKAHARAEGDASAATFDAELLEDLYLPYKLKRKTKAATRARRASSRWPTGSGTAAHGTEQPQARRDARAAGLHLPQRREGLRRRGRRAGGRGGHPDRAPGRDAGAAPARAHGALRAGLRAHGQGRQGQDAQQVRALLRPIRSPCASCSSRENSHRYLAMRRGWMEEELCSRSAARWPTTARPIRCVDELVARVRGGGLPAGRTLPGAAAAQAAARLALRPTSRRRSRAKCTRRCARSPTRPRSASSPRTSASCCWPRRSAPRPCWASTRACAPAASWRSSTRRGATSARG